MAPPRSGSATAGEGPAAADRLRGVASAADSPAEEERGALLRESKRSGGRHGDERGQGREGQRAMRCDRMPEMHQEHKQYVKRLRRLEKLYVRLQTPRRLVAALGALFLSSLLLSAVILFLFVLWDPSGNRRLLWPAAVLVKAFGVAFLATTVLGTIASVIIFCIFKVGTLLFFASLYIHSILLSVFVSAICTQQLKLMEALLASPVSASSPVFNAAPYLLFAFALLLYGVCTDTPHLWAWITLPSLLITQVLIVEFHSFQAAQPCVSFLSVLRTAPSWIAFMLLLVLHAGYAAVYSKALSPKGAVSFFWPPNPCVIRYPSFEDHTCLGTEPRYSRCTLSQSFVNSEGAPWRGATTYFRTPGDITGSEEQQRKRIIAKYKVSVQRSLWRHAVTAAGCGLIVVGIILLSIHCSTSAPDQPLASAPAATSFLRFLLLQASGGKSESLSGQGAYWRGSRLSDDGETSRVAALKHFLSTSRAPADEQFFSRERNLHPFVTDFPSSVRASLGGNVLTVRSAPWEASYAKHHERYLARTSRALRHKQSPRRAALRSRATQDQSLDLTASSFAFAALSAVPDAERRPQLHPGEALGEATVASTLPEEGAEDGAADAAPGGLDFVSSDSGAGRESTGSGTTLLLYGILSFGCGVALASAQLVWLLACWIDSLVFSAMALINRNPPCVLKAPDMFLPPETPELGEAGPLLSKLFQSRPASKSLKGVHGAQQAASGASATDSSAHSDSTDEEDLDSESVASVEAAEFPTDSEDDWTEKQAEQVAVHGGDRGTGLEGQ
ncbi:hypothetical protein BESB_072250 [Besnoitia besnoiti]|uniref:Transmembrane protein n=1 Tax=Besnoitia besnoiti TaxID=94643 RepID=A0A2A9MEH1_BESBE|nr:uncharacterized protein BESB_072250 [Besnoitia besnoiti]PFH34073.1 hypothetical protein BESB_072250 [Besnoitia besnoiti]